MNKKILFFAFIFTILTGCISAYALDASLTGDVISVNGNGFNAESRIPVVITKPEYDIAALSDGNIKEGTIFAYEAITSSDGELSFKARLPKGSPAGWYTVWAGPDSDEFYYATENEIESAVTAFAEATDSTIGDAIQTYSVSKPIVYLNLDGSYAAYTEYVQKLFVIQLGLAVPESVGDIQNTYDLSLDIAAFAKDDAATIEALLTNASYSSYVDDDNGVADVSSAFVNVRPNEIYTLDELALAMRKANALAALNGAQRTKVMDLVADYNDVLSLDLTGDYLKCAPIEVAKVIAGQGFVSIEEVRKAFSKRVSELTASKKEKTSSSSGGSGGPNFSAQINNDSAVSSPQSPSNSDKDDLEFSDMIGYEWASSYVTSLSQLGVVNGIGSGLFDPSGYVTREQYVKMLALALKASVLSGDCVFADVAPEAWYADYVAWANVNGIVTGVSETEFGVGKPITREDMCTIAYRALNSMQITLEQGVLKFDDASGISAYASDAVAALAASGIISGRDNGSFAPQDCCNRAEAAKVVYFIMQKAGVLNG